MQLIAFGILSTTIFIFFRILSVVTITICITNVAGAYLIAGFQERPVRFMLQKHLFRVLLVFTAVVVFFLLFHALFQWKTVLNQEVSLVLPAAVYISPDKDLQFEYADMFRAHTQYLAGSELAYHVDLLTNRTDIHGYVEVWNMDTSLSVFLEKAKAAFSPSVTQFQETFPTADYNTRIWEYEIADGIHAKQYFSQTDGKLLVIALFAPTSLWSEEYDAMFSEITQSATLQ